MYFMPAENPVSATSSIYRVVVYDRTFTELVVLMPSDFNDLQYFNELNKPGGATFRMRVRNVKSDPIKIKVTNRIVIFKGGIAKFVGYIDQIDADLNQLTVQCVGLLDVFARRITSYASGTNPANTVFYAILAEANSNNNTYVTAGTSDVTYGLLNMNFERSTVLDAWSQIAKASGNAQFRINPDTKVLDFKKSIGSDLSTSVILKYNINEIERANIYDFNVRVLSADMTNKVYGTGDNSTVVVSDAISINNYGSLESTQSFLQTQNSGNLTDQAQAYVDTHKAEYYEPILTINPSKINTDTFDVYDLIRVQLNNGFIDVDQVNLITMKRVTLRDSGTEQVELQTVSSSLPIAQKQPVVGDIKELARRVRLLEGFVT